MALVMCPLCMEQEDVEVLGVLSDGRQKARCRPCGYPFAYGAALRRLPTADMVSSEDLARAERLKSLFLAREHAGLDPRVPAFWAKYQDVFNQAGLRAADPAVLRAFAAGDEGADPGIQSTFLAAFDDNPEYGAAHVRQIVDYLLRGTSKPLEDRLTDLINGRLPFSFPGFKEVLLSKVLSVAYPDRFLTLLTYQEKTAAAEKVYGLELPPLEPARIGHQIVWSNDLLLGLAGEGFMHRAPHAGEFLWWAKDQL